MTEKIRTLTQLTDALDKDLAWRKKELIFLKSLIDTHQSKPTESTFIRSGLTILYAHWEGFVKNAATLYLEFICRQNLSYEDLIPNIVALAIRVRLDQARETNKAIVHTDLAKFFMTELSEKCSISWKEAINTQSNLNSTVLHNIILALGLDYLPYQTKANLIDEALLASRNAIAHGQYLQIDYDGYVNLYHEMLNLIELLRNQIDNAAAMKLYQRTSNLMQQ